MCFACEKPIHEKVEDICLNCRIALPRVMQSKNHPNPVEKIFKGRLQLERATAFLRFEKQGKLQSLLHHLKYKGVSSIGLNLGELAAVELLDYNFFEGIEAIVPLPIHPKKVKIRGYNQSDLIAEGIAKVTGLEVLNTSIIKDTNSASQTRKSRFERWQNVATAFKVTTTDKLKHKHVLLVDDVVTTGATAESCGLTLLNVDGLKLSFLSIACTY
ncbi:MAG: amidophosphoribosyltransferase [Verrucomicrobia bacterium]|nr:amidophosphoribosyltransferase [Verrucomicrobiota bacterium]|tara:strand:- start:430 stop:1074 length:645 start_codon:yes stop_codon:yes gene_type:complete